MLRDPASPSRPELRRRLLEERSRFAASAQWNDAEEALGRELQRTVDALEPECLGLYWPYRSEFNAARVLVAGDGLSKRGLALPFARRTPPSMEYRGWDGALPRTVDECGIAASDGGPARPDVVLVPCVGYSESGFRLGYGGGYFDRWLAAHPDVCAVGVAWSAARLDESILAPLPHDVRLAFIVTERGSV